MNSRTTPKYRHQIRCVTRVPQPLYRKVIDVMDELDSYGVRVSVMVADDGVTITSATTADRLMASAEFRRRGFVVAA